jgi:hypothetical protein
MSARDLSVRCGCRDEVSGMGTRDVGARDIGVRDVNVKTLVSDGDVGVRAMSVRRWYQRP